MSATSEVKKILQQYPNFTIDELRKNNPDLKFTNSVFYTARYSLGLTQKLSQNEDSQKQKILSIIQTSPQGISCADIMSQMCITASAVYGALNSLRRSNNYKIKNKNGKYFFIGQNQKTHQTALQSVMPSTVTLSSNGDISQKLLSEISLLSESDKADYFDMVKKSVFYKLSSDSLLKANAIVNEMKNPV
jgi:hypothetical protein